MKPRIRLLAAAAALLALSACERSITLDEQSLLGTWRGDEHYSDPGGYGPKDAYPQLTFGPGGAFRYEYFMYGEDGKPATELTLYSRTDGAYRIRNGRLELKEDVRTYGTPDGTPGSTQVLGGEWADAGTVEVSGDHLVRRYLTYPADAPEMTVVAFTRVAN